MKKIAYITPTLHVMMVAPATLVAASPSDITGAGTNPFSSAGEGGVGEEADVKRRNDYNVWDEDWSR